MSGRRRVKAFKLVQRFPIIPDPRRAATYDPEGITTLLEMLTYRRPAVNVTTEQFCAKFIKSIYPEVFQDEFYNLILQIGENPTVLWSAHTDSVHREGGLQKVDVSGGWAYTLDPKSNCLGADNAAGCWMLRELALAQVPGLYIWHDSEECGGSGSNSIVKRTPHLLDGIQVAIAFDRRGTTSVITEQGGGMTASDECAQSIADLLGMKHAPDDGGLFTDTANYADIIPECTNISTGTTSEHTSAETLDLNYLWDLRNAVLAADWSQVVVKRTPGDFGWYSPRFSKLDFDFMFTPTPTKQGSEMDLEDLCREYPEVAADLLASCSVREDDFRWEVRQRGGMLDDDDENERWEQ